MKKGYKIGLFFVIMVIVGLIAIILYRRTIFPNNEDYDGNIELDLSQVDNTPLRTTCDTVIVYQDFDKKDGIDKITIRQLLTHTSGLDGNANKGK